MLANMAIKAMPDTGPPQFDVIIDPRPVAVAMVEIRPAVNSILYRIGL